MRAEPLLAVIGSDHHRLVRAAARLLGPADAEDAVQDAYVRVLETATPELDSPPAWLLTVVRHLAIDHLRRRHWMQHWLADISENETLHVSPSAELDVGMAQQVVRALRLLAARLSPADGACVLLHEVFGFGHAEIAQASGKSEAGSRQQLRRSLARLRQAGGSTTSGPDSEPEPHEETFLRQYLQSLQSRDPRMLWAMLRQPAISARSGLSSVGSAAATAPPATTCGVIQVGGKLGLVLTLDGVMLCVLPLGVQSEREPENAPV